MRGLDFARSTPLALAVVLLAAGCKPEQPAGKDNKTPATGGGGEAASAGGGGAEILFGHVGSLTGPTATFGIGTKNGIELAIKQQNAKGGLLGKKLRAIHLDDQGRPEEAK